MKRWRWVDLLPLLVTACSGLTEEEAGVVSLEIQFPIDRTLDVGEQAKLTAQALNADGQVVDATIVWSASNPALSVDATGLVTGVQPGSGEVQAAVGSLTSERVDFEVRARPDALIIVGDSVVVIPAATEPPATANLVVRLESLSPPGPASGSPVIYQITQPAPGTTPVVALNGGVQGDTLDTGTDGTVVTAIGRVAGQVAPDTAIVEVRANRTDGSAVPGSGQRFIILFQ